jgi:hypothetical protein
MNQNITIFYSYAHEDQALADELKKHLNILKLQGLISNWYDHDINAGENQETQNNERLETADIILPIISSSFLASDYCYSREMQNALKRHEARIARVIPINARPTYWHKTPFASLQALPKDGKPITKWKSRDLAFLDIAIGIRNAVEEFSQRKAPSEELSLTVGASSGRPSKELENTLGQLEDTLRDSYSVIRNYEEIVRYSDDPKEKAQARQSIEIQRNLARDFLDKYMKLVNQLGVSVPIDITQISGYIGYA